MSAATCPWIYLPPTSVLTTSAETIEHDWIDGFEQLELYEPGGYHLSNFGGLSIDKFREKFGEPETVLITRVGGKPLPPNAPPQAVEPLYLGEKARDFTLADVRGLVLNDFRAAFSPVSETRLGRKCNTPVGKRAPEEALFEPNTPLSSGPWVGGAPTTNSPMMGCNVGDGIGNASCVGGQGWSEVHLR